MEIKINAKIGYDFEKAKFYLAEWDVVNTEYAPLGKSPRRPGLRPVSEQLRRRGMPKYRDAE